MNKFLQFKANWIWPLRVAGENQYVQFRHEFMLESVHTNSQIALSADTSYALWLNGCFVHYGQFHDWPGEKTYDVLEIADYLRPGKNVACVLAYYQGANSAHYIASDPGIVYVIASGKQIVTSGLDTLWRKDPAYRTQSLPRITPQLHFTFEYDSRHKDNWLAADYACDAAWQRIQKQDMSDCAAKTFALRPVKRTILKERLDAKIITQGFFRQSGRGQTIAQEMQQAFLSYRDAAAVFDTKPDVFPAVIKTAQIQGDGVYIIVDLGREEVGLFELEMDTDAGTVIDVAYGEHLDDMRVRAAIGGRNFANRYIACKGLQKFTHYFTRFAGRYIQLHISGFVSRCSVQYAALRSVEYPIEEKSVFKSSCQLQNTIYKTAVRTLHLSMHEHYEDCPWREQALYANDSRNQALCGYYCFGEYAFPAASFDLLGKGLKSDGYLELCAPADMPITIPSFTFVWILAMADHLLYSGDLAHAATHFAVVKKIIDSRLADLADGLLACPRGPRYWQFYDWASGLDGTIMGDCTRFAQLSGVRFDAPLNMFFALAMRSAAAIARHCGDADYAAHLESCLKTLKRNIHSRFCDGSAGLYRTYAGDEDCPKNHAELTQSLAILADVCGMEEAVSLRRYLADDKNEMVKTTLSQSLYKFEALLTDKINYGKYVFDKVNADWGGMLFRGATSFWETLNGAADFDNAGSLCHGWSAVPVYLYHGHLLGIRPLEPGFKKFLFDPSVCAVNAHHGQIATPGGVIEIKLQRCEDHIIGEIVYPKQLAPVVAKNKALQDVVLQPY
jgi:hypothetical protein